MNLVLLGHYRAGYRLSYYFDWRDAFLTLKDHSVHVINTALPGRWPRPVFERLPLPWSFPEREVHSLYAGEIPCDVLVIPHSFYYFNQGRRRRLLEDLAARGSRRFTTAFFMENEYRQLPDKVAYARALNASVLVSQLPLEAASALYAPHFPGTIVSAPSALNPDVYRPGPPLPLRTIDVGTRSHVYPASLGDSERNELLRRFVRGDGPLARLTLDISVEEKDRLSRQDWSRFLGSCRATVATEAGAAELSWDGRPPLVSGKAVSSRHFEALGTKTAQIMFPGRFNDLLWPGEHYLPLERDFRNLEDVCAAVKDTERLVTMTDRAYEYALSGHTYDHRVRSILRAV